MSTSVRIARAFIAVLAAVGVLTASTLAHRGLGSVAPDARAVILPSSVRDSMNREFARNNEHWDELTEMNTLEQMLGNSGPTQREYLGCLQGRVEGPVVRVSGWSEARDLRQRQFWVAGNCDGVPDRVGTWHTHPYRADPANRPIRQRGLSRLDLDTFAVEHDPLMLVVWDVDSIEAAIQLPDGTVVHPAKLQVE